MTLLSTYISSKEDVSIAIDSGVFHLIIDDPRFSIRSFSHSNNYQNYNNIIELVEFSRAFFNDVKLSFNLDIMLHEDSFFSLDDLLTLLDTLKLDFIRVQDLGLGFYIFSNFPNLKLHFLSETGNLNTRSSQILMATFHRQTLSNELPFSALQSFSMIPNSSFELLIHGPILIQYSPRKFLAGYHKDFQSINSPHYHRIQSAFDNDYPNRKFRFYENKHGHFMYLFFDRCLIKYISDLNSLSSFDSWLIDCRGYDSDLFKLVLKCYSECFFDNGNSNKCFSKLSESSLNPLKPGFFRANKTDLVRMSSSNAKNACGKVIDVVKGSTLIIQLSKLLHNDSSLYVYSQRGNKIFLNLDTFHDLDGNSRTSFSIAEYYKIPWIKGVTPNSVIYF